MRLSIKQLFAVAAMAVVAQFAALAQAPGGYYKAAEGKSGAELLKTLESIVGEHTNVGYNGLWSLYKKSDVTADGYIWDMYSTAKFTPGKQQCGSYSAVGDCYNREHSFPKSWFNDASPMVSDAFHIVPTDGKVNGQRSNYPYGECANGNTLSSSGSVRALGKLGRSTFPGYSGTVFEPDDQYKGDFARNYFYMAAAYNSRIGSWHSDMLAGNSYPAFSSWAINLLLKWSRQDPVSQKEIDRNNAVYAAQHNRNPFIDHPELVEYIWGNSVGQGWTPGGVQKPVLVEPVSGTTLNLGLTATGKAAKARLTVKGVQLTQTLTVTVAGSGFAAGTATITAAQANAGTAIEVTYTSATPAANATGTLTLASSEVSATVTLKASATSGIPALEATGVTTGSFVARWVDVDADGASYTLAVNRAADGQAVSGYPLKVSAASQQHAVDGLEAGTAYTYQLSAADGRKSNVVSVSTIAPTPILAFTQPEGGFNLSCTTGSESPVIEAGVYTEHVNEPVILTVDGNFELSLNKTDWSKRLTLDADGENFYLRIADTKREGKFTGTLALGTEHIDGEEADVNATVGAPQSFIEDFEAMGTGGYWTGLKEGSACRWNFENAGVWGDGNDHPIDSRCVRMGKSGASSIAMADDKTSGAGTVTFKAAAYGSDSNAELELSYSTDAGAHWTLLSTFTVGRADDGNLNSYSCATGGITGNVRFKWTRTDGKRVNIDNIAITDYTSGLIGVDAGRNWDACPAGGGITLTPATSVVTQFAVYDMAARTVFSGALTTATKVALPAGVYVVSADGHSKKVVVKK